MNRFVRLPLVPGVKAVTLSVGMGLPPIQYILGLQWLLWGHHLEAATVCRRCGQSLDLQAKVLLQIHSRILALLGKSWGV
jgi:hypothetical protein